MEYVKHAIAVVAKKTDILSTLSVLMIGFLGVLSYILANLYSHGYTQRDQLRSGAASKSHVPKGSGVPAPNGLFPLSCVACDKNLAPTEPFSGACPKTSLLLQSRGSKTA